ncbi:hypothetical protein [uncultured Williamsia sp.]|uniref:hypothetical protein n=1 Tax=uncultured Williamsia sp. TaxID=259311 RepID=UPI002629A674|nr:hypothetical protein [uncultured Williamsia sp.]
MSLVDLLTAAGVDLEERFGTRTAERLRHVCDPAAGPVFLPYGWIDLFPADNPGASPRAVIRTDTAAGVSPHPSNPDQLLMVSIIIDGEEPIGAAQWVSIAHLAHRDCPLCATVWADRAAEHAAVQHALQNHDGGQDHSHTDPYERWSLFVRTPTEDSSAVALVHIGDTAPWREPDQ